MPLHAYKIVADMQNNMHMPDVPNVALTTQQVVQ